MHIYIYIYTLHSNKSIGYETKKFDSDRHLYILICLRITLFWPWPFGETPYDPFSKRE